MAKKSETLSQREKAQKDLLELKKMQRGEIKPEKEKEVVPQTFKEKKENFFFYHKYKLIFIAAAVIVLAIIIYSTVTKIDYDASVTIYRYEYVFPEETEAAAKWLENYYTDVNGNGKVEISAEDCSFGDEDLADTVHTRQLKIQAILNQTKAMLFILDEESLEYLNGISDKIVLFTEENMAELPANYYKAVGIEKLASDEKKRYIALRTIDDTVLEGDAQENYIAAKGVIEKIKAEK